MMQKLMHYHYRQHPATTVVASAETVLGVGLERPTTSRPRSALSIRRERSLINLEKATLVAEQVAKPRLQRRASSGSIKNGNFMAGTVASGARAIPKGQSKSNQQGRARVALGVRVQGLATDTVAPQFDREGFRYHRRSVYEVSWFETFIRLRNPEGNIR